MFHSCVVAAMKVRGAEPDGFAGRRNLVAKNIVYQKMPRKERI
jgi:hypothetical protein